MARPPRLKDFSYIGQYRYFLTFCTYNRNHEFEDEQNVCLVLTQMVRTSSEMKAAIHAYCFMPDHVHVLSEGLEKTTDLRSFVNTLKQDSGWDYRRERGRRLWQPGYYDHVLRPEEGTSGVLAYIVNNPVRAGLAAEPSAYPFWGSLTRTREEILALMRGEGEWKPGGP